MATGSESVMVRKVLFVGDSLTYVNDLDKVVKGFAEAAYPDVVFSIDTEVKGGAPLSALWKRTNARKRIASERYDVVVLQEDLPETNVETFHHFAEQFHEVIHPTGAATVFLMTWPYQRLGWISHEGIERAHLDIAKKLGARVAAAGVAWQLAQSRQRRLKLYGDDNEHPSLHGTYLAAAVVFSTLWGRSPVGLNIMKANGIASTQATFMQKLAWEVAQRYRCHEHCTAGSGDADRDKLVSDVFALLDRDQDLLLNEAEIRPFEDFVGFRGGETAWSEEYQCLCKELSCDSVRGIPLHGFAQLVNLGTQNGLFCTDCSTEELQEFYLSLRSQENLHGPAKPSLQFTAADVAQHAHEEDCWAVVNGYVLDMTSFLGQHPGGKAKIMSCVGRDASADFNSHFGFTVQALKKACRAFDKQAHGPTECVFPGGNGQSVGSVRIIGKLVP